MGERGHLGLNDLPRKPHRHGFTCLAESDSLSQRPTPTGFSQMSGLPCTPAAHGRAVAARLQPVMLRLVDDFLVISPSRAVAEALVFRIMQGAFLDKLSPGLLSQLKRSWTVLVAVCCLLDDLRLNCSGILAAKLWDLP